MTHSSHAAVYADVRACVSVCVVIVLLTYLLIYFFTGYSYSIDGHLMELCLTAVKFARKKGNIVLASRLLSQCHDGTQDKEQKDELSQAFRLLSLRGTVGEKWGPELQIEKAKVLRTAGKK